MPVKEIAGVAGSADPIKDSKSKASEKAKAKAGESTDKAEVSDEARALYEAEHTGRFEAIREKIKSGFYFQKDVMEKVVDAMLKEIRKGPSDT